MIIVVALDPLLKNGRSTNTGSTGYWISSDDNRCRIPNIDVGYERSLLSFSYSADPEIFERVRPVIRIFEKHGYVAHDAQASIILSANYVPLKLADGFSATRDQVINGLRALGEVVIGMSPTPKAKRKPWWHFW
jgi:hypothetical protein